MPASIVTWIAKAIGAVWLLVGACLLAVVLVEAAGRIGYGALDAASLAIHHRKPPGPTPCNRVMAALRLSWQPYTYWRGAPARGALVTVEADGRRRTWRPPDLDPRAPLVVMTGGSAVWGMCVRDDETIPSWLARELAAGRTTARVENHAQIGWVSTQSLMDLMLDLRSARVPRVVIFYDGWNDIVAGLAEGSPGIPLNEAARAAEFNLLTHPGRLRLAALGHPTHSALGRLARAIRHRVRPASAPDVIPDGWRQVFGADTSEARLDSVAREVVRVYEWNVGIVELLARTCGFHPLFYWQPDVVGKQTLSATERGSLAENPLMVRFARQVRRAVAESAALRACGDFRDLEGEFDDDEAEVFFDWCHVTREANARIAGAISRDVRRALAAPAGGTLPAGGRSAGGSRERRRGRARRDRHRHGVSRRAHAARSRTPAPAPGLTKPDRGL
ncbi:MAG: hypothetical protein HZC42_00615 [Candidatus Eisenbacteria bacterium]|nr:hypothetical protein [Candidatus Eisenbacteria bacterium]